MLNTEKNLDVGIRIITPNPVVWFSLFDMSDIHSLIGMNKWNREESKCYHSCGGVRWTGLLRGPKTDRDRV